jgi:hypothetical protein
MPRRNCSADQSQPEVIYEIPPAKLEPYFAQWEAKLTAQGQPESGAPNHMNNPKIPLKFVATHGVQVWPRLGHRRDGSQL